ncbi:NEDD8 protease nep2 [Homalodisca vitripennis]|nr:NEDD8 protease nep2 [Homalodisca vitripennis]
MTWTPLRGYIPSKANQILSYLDSTVNPCDDFYKFACGGFIDSAEIDNDKAENSSFSQVDSKVDEQLKVIVSEPPTKDEPSPFRSLKHLFSLCMDEKKLDARGVGPALNIIKGAGGWPVLGNWKRKNWNILDTYIRLRKFMVGEDSLFQIYVEVDMKNNSRRIIQVDQASLGLPQELFVEGPSNAMVKEYFSLMVDVAVMLGADRKTAMKQLRSSLYFEIELAKIMTVKEKRRDFNRMYNLYKLSDMTAELGWNWGSLFQRILPESMSLKRDELINVVEVEYLKKLKRLMQSHPKEELASASTTPDSSKIPDRLCTSIDELESSLSENNILHNLEDDDEKLEMAAKIGAALLEENNLLKEKNIRLESKVDILEELVGRMENEENKYLSKIEYRISLKYRLNWKEKKNI